MAIKAVFFDIDGTLLNDRKNVQKSTIKAIRNLKDQGILVGLATGRGPSFVQPFLENLGLDFAVTYNGQYIYSRSEIIYTNQLSKTTVYCLIRYAGARRREISLGTASGLLGSGIIGLGTSRLGQIVSSLVPRKWAKAIERSFKHFIRRIKPQNIDSLMVILREPIYQVVLVATEGESERIQKQFPRVKLTRSSPYSQEAVLTQWMSFLKGSQKLRELNVLVNAMVLIYPK